MYVVLGASGNTGHVVARNLLSAGQQVRVVGRNEAHLQPLAAQGAQTFVADVTDAAALAAAFDRAHSAYVMIPPDLTAKNFRDYEARVSDAITTALKKSSVKNVVMLSSVGADKSSGTGPVVGVHDFENKLRSISPLNALFLRPGYFMENTLSQAGAIKAMNATAGPVLPDLPLPMIATQDIGAAAAQALLDLDFPGHQTRELLGQRDLSYSEVATIIGKAICKPDLRYVHAPDDQVRGFMVQAGMSENMANLILEMSAALNSGHMKSLEPRSAKNTTLTSFETFVAEVFVPAYQPQQAA